MNSSNPNIIHNDWAIYLITFLVLIVLFFVQKYAYLIDRKLNQFNNNKTNWEGKSWPLPLALFLGTITLLYNVFSPEKLQQNPANWIWAEWVLIFCFLVLLGILVAESISHFGARIGILRFLILSTLCVGFYFAGLLAGLLIISILALLILIYFINFWRKKMILK